MPDQIKQRLRIDTEKCMIMDMKTGNEAEGLVLVDILIDQNEHHPHIYYKTLSTNENIACVCRLCAETKSRTCNHGPLDRMLHVEIPICEANYALSQGESIFFFFPKRLRFPFLTFLKIICFPGASIINLYEAWVFDDKHDIFYDFYTVVSWFVNLLKCPEDADPVTYCQKLDKLMGYVNTRKHSDMKLDPDKCGLDSWLKKLVKVYKLLRIM